jgi:hypothetical protein
MTAGAARSEQPRLFVVDVWMDVQTRVFQHLPAASSGELQRESAAVPGVYALMSAVL